MKGIVIAGGNGTRLYPLTKVINKHLLPIYDKPAIYYPLSVLMNANINEIIIVIKEQEYDSFYSVLGNGEDFGIDIMYVYQNEALGIADALLRCEDLVSGCFCVILGDNFFYGSEITRALREELDCYIDGMDTMFCVPSADSSVATSVEFSENGNIINLHFKNDERKGSRESNVCPGIYIYDVKVFKYIKELNPSDRNEIEIIDLNRVYLLNERIKLRRLSSETVWLDLGSYNDRMLAENLVLQVQGITGRIIACLEEIGLEKGWIKKTDVKQKIKSVNVRDCIYLEYLKRIVQENDEI